MFDFGFEHLAANRPVLRPGCTASPGIVSVVAPNRVCDRGQTRKSDDTCRRRPLPVGSRARRALRNDRVNPPVRLGIAAVRDGKIKIIVPMREQSAAELQMRANPPERRLPGIRRATASDGSPGDTWSGSLKSSKATLSHFRHERQLKLHHVCKLVRQSRRTLDAGRVSAGIWRRDSQ